jgi:hypothetical protein
MSLVKHDNGGGYVACPEVAPKKGTQVIINPYPANVENRVS